MVLVGLAFFVVVFAALFPVLTDPAGAYDRWFPREERIAEESETDRTANPYLGPSARFAWETLTVEDGDPPLYRVRLESQARSGSTAVVEWKWDFGDGTTGTGESIIHDYDAAASYTVTLAIEDASGRGDSVRGSVPVGSSESILGSAGNIDGLVGFDDELDAFTDDISASLEDAVGSVGDDITDTLDTALGSIGATVRGAVVAVLFALAALAATMPAAFGRWPIQSETSPDPGVRSSRR